MWYRIVNWFTKITAWPVQFLCFRTKVLYEDRGVQGRRIRGPAIIVSNHTSVFDYAVYLFVFYSRTLRVQMAEVLFRKKVLGFYLRQMGGILVNRDTRDFSFLTRSAAVLQKGGVVGIFPEGRLPRSGEDRPLPFQSGAAFLALQTNVPVIPVYTNGSYFSKKRCTVVIGTPVDPGETGSLDLPDKEKIERLSTILRDRVMELGNLYERA